MIYKVLELLTQNYNKCKQIAVIFLSLPVLPEVEY